MNVSEGVVVEEGTEIKGEDGRGWVGGGSGSGGFNESLRLVE